MWHAAEDALTFYCLFLEPKDGQGAGWRKGKPVVNSKYLRSA